MAAPAAGQEVVGQCLQENAGLTRMAASLGSSVAPQDEDTLSVRLPLR